jgi:hypothetical protein
MTTKSPAAKTTSVDALDPDADPLVVLRAEFDRELAILDDQRTAAKLHQAFDASPAQIARAANKAARRRR